MHQVLFTIGLSNGETIAEEKGNYQTLAGELSPWRRALAYINQRGVTITSLSLYTRDGQRWSVPSLGKNPKFHAFAVAEKPVSYNFFRQMGADVNRETGDTYNEEQYAVVEATYADGTKLQTWVHNSTFASWSLII